MKLALSSQKTLLQALIVAGWMSQLPGDATELDLDTNEVILDHLTHLIKTNFSSTKLDTILNLPALPPWIADMMDTKR